MKLIYHLSISTYKGERQRWLSVHYADKHKAITELKRWADKFRKEWEVPEKSNGRWYISNHENNEMDIDFQNTGYGRTRENRCLFSGHVYEDRLIEEGEEVVAMCGEVFSSGDNPDILFTNCTPLLDDKLSFCGKEPINMVMKERSDFLQATGGANLQSEELATEYYNLRTEIIKRETDNLFSK